MAQDDNRYHVSSETGASWDFRSRPQNEFRPTPLLHCLLLPFTCGNPLCLTETYDSARCPSLRSREGAAAEDQDHGDDGDRSRSGRTGVDVPQLARGAQCGQVLRRAPAPGLRNRLCYLFQRSRLAKASAEIFSVHIRGLLSRLGTGRRVGSHQVPQNLRIGQHKRSWQRRGRSRGRCQRARRACPHVRAEIRQNADRVSVLDCVGRGPAYKSNPPLLESRNDGFRNGALNAMSRKWFLVLLGALSFAALSWSQDLGEWTDSYVKGLAPANHFRGTIAAERNGQVLVEKSYCAAVEEWQIPNSLETKFEIASLTKQFTAAAILQLADNGKIECRGSGQQVLP